jgi:hypothetical protein
LGYHILLEKPMATTAEDCRAIYDAVKRNGIILAVCHVLRWGIHKTKLFNFSIFISLHPLFLSLSLSF